MGTYCTWDGAISSCNCCISYTCGTASSMELDTIAVAERCPDPGFTVHLQTLLLLRPAARHAAGNTQQHPYHRPARL